MEFKPAKRIFVSADGDGIGQEVEKAVMANDLKGIVESSNRIRKGQEYLKSKFEELGAETLVHGGDDNLFRVSKESIDRLEDIRQGYNSVTGYTVTFGVGNEMRDAVKSLVYGKLTGKNKMVFWKPELKEELRRLSRELTPAEKAAEHGLLPEAEEAEQKADGWEDQIPGGKADRLHPDNFDREKLKAGFKVEMEHTSDPKIALEITMDHLAEDEDYYEKLKEVHKD